MESHCIPFSNVPYFAFNDTAYATGHPALTPFFRYKPSLDAFKDVLRDKSAMPTDRDLLVRVLKEQYAALHPSGLVQAHIEALAQPNTFTVITAHQPSLFTGPLYYIYKILGTINLAETLQDAYPDYRFIPVFISGSEDHDFEEINHAHLFGKTLTWETQAGGSTGFLPTNTLEPVLAQLGELLQSSENGLRIYNEIQAAYTSHPFYGEAAQDLVNRLFGKYGLVVLDMRHRELKRAFIPIMREELFHQPSQVLVEQTQKALEAAGFSGQAHAREVNLFYLHDGKRSRIVKEGEAYHILGTSIHFSATDLENELTQYPERFSPNVVLRPLYQEFILPNLAYIGGGGEIAYWLERKRQFEHFGINFPMLIRRNSVLWIDKGSSQRMDKLGINAEQLFQDADTLIRHYVDSQTEHELSLSQEIASLNALFEGIRQKAIHVDPTLEKTILAEAAKQVKVLEHLEVRLLRAEKQKHDTAIGQIRHLKEKLFPGHGLQERHDNFISLYQKYGDELFETLKAHLHPLEEGMLVLIDN
ncbi:MAG: bacillithiol biosynthesis cysteine-adding enzyme BshC [Haliscomenobacter sp.]|nr:bacillithiol biosynthesis cysteine-adding enzyme BshC [Haliscomenobacter sp.]